MFSTGLFRAPLRNSLLSLMRVNSVVVFLLFSLTCSIAYAKPLPEFDATFEVHAFDIVLGNSKQSLNCQGEKCTLSATAKPSGLASLFISEKTHEEIKLTQNGPNLTWHSYVKQAGDDLKDKKKLKTVSLIRASDSSNIFYPEKDKQWPNQTKIFDIVSIAYALQHHQLNKLAIEGFYLQDTYGQEKLSIRSNQPVKELELADFKTQVKAVPFEFNTSKANVKIWLLPEHHYFPGRVDVYNIEKEKTITLLLKKLPNIR